MKKLFLIDAYALIFRFYYAFIGRPMRNADGVNTSAVFGFVRYINEIIRRENPHYLGVAFDPPGGNFRHELFADYKANRGETPEDIIVSVPYIKEFLEAMRIPVIEVPGYEADDVIGTLSREAAEAGFEVFMVTPDKDYGQLIRPNVYIYKQRKGGNEGVEIIGCEQVCEHYGIDDPKQVIDILALWGDASDNIPGVPGIGEKSAVKLICQYGTVENLLDNTEKLSGKQRENIERLREQILLAKRLATIEQHVPVAFEPEKMVMESPDADRLAELEHVLELYKSVDEEKLFENFKYFLDGIIPTCEEVGVKMACHPDDPGWPIFGLPRITHDQAGFDRMVKLHDSPCNTLCLCTGSLGSSPDNDIPSIIRHFGEMNRIGCLHVRNIKHLGSDRRFRESSHLSSDGDLDMYEIMKAAYETCPDTYIRPDHGRMIWDEIGRPGYGLYDRALGIAYLNGLWEAIDKNAKRG